MRDVVRLSIFAVVIFGVSLLSVAVSDPGFARTLTDGLGLAQTASPSSPASPSASTPSVAADAPAATVAQPATPPATSDAAATPDTAAAANPDAAPAADSTSVASPERLAEGGDVVRIPGSSGGAWVGLAGFPSERTLSFRLPAGVEEVEGQLQLDLESELIDRGDGLLTVWINGREQDAVVLQPGTTMLRLTYPLDPSDLAGEQVNVRLQADGTTNFGQICPTNVTNLGFALSLLEGSGLVLRLDGAADDVVNRIVLAPDPLAISAPDAPIFGAWGTQWLSRQGVPSQLAVPGDTSSMTLSAASAEQPASVDSSGAVTLAGVEGLDEVLGIRGGMLPQSYDADWPVPVEALSTDLAYRTFRGSSRWNITYKLADLPQGLAPARISLALRTSQLAEGNDWSLRVILNDNIVHTANFPGDSDTIRTDVDLPQDLQQLSNRLMVILVDNSPNQGICRAGREAVAQLLPETAFQPVDAPDGAEQTLVSALAGSGGVSLVGPEQASGQATAATSALLDLVLPLDVPVSLGEEEGFQIRMLSDEDQELVDASSTGASTATQQYIVQWQSGSGDEDVVVVPLSDWQPASPGEPIEPGSLLVSW